jgi:hypothetical protein
MEYHLIMMKKEKAYEQGQSIFQDNQAKSSFINDKGQSSIQDNLAVESHNLSSSEGQLSKPTSSYGADVIAALSLGDELVHADGGDLLALQATGKHPEHSSVENGGIVLSLNFNPDIVIYESKKFTGCSLVRCEIPTSRTSERRQRMRDDEHYLRQDSRFWNILEQVKFSVLGPERIKMIDDFWAGAYRGYYSSERDLIRARGRIPAEYIALHDEDVADEEAATQDLERVRRSWRPSHVVVGGGVDQSSDSMKCERSYGPSHVEDGGGDPLLGTSSFQGDRRSPVQSERFRARDGPSQC